MEVAETRRFPLMPLAGLGAMMIAGLAALLIARSVSSSNAWVDHSIQIQTRIIELGERLAVHDGAMRGYLIGRAAQMQDEREEAGHDILAGLAALRTLVSDNDTQTREVDAVRPLILKRLAFSRKLADLRDRVPLDRIRLTPEDPNGFPLILAIRQHLGRLYATESRLLAERQRQAQQRISALSIGLAATVMLVVASAYLTVSGARQRYETIERAHRDARNAMAAAETEARAREEAEAQLRQVQKMESLGQLTGGIAHDFNNMLAVVIGSLDMARRRIDDRPRLERSLASALEGAGRAASLVSRLLAYSRRQSLAPAATDANQLVAGLSDLLNRTLGEEIKVETDLAHDLWPTFIDPLQLENAILNLAVNARDALDGRGRMLIKTRNATLSEDYVRANPDVSAGDYAMILVRDYGIGMSPEVMARAFDPFFTTKGVGKGTGLGLSQVFGFVKQSGGHVSIESREGAGTSIRLFLPRFAEPAAAPNPAAPPPAPAAAASGEKILLVEDDDRVRQFSLEAVRDLGYSAMAAENGAAALTLIDGAPDVALLFTDVVMPGMNGTELAAAVKAKRPDIKILYTTGYAHETIAKRGLKVEGADVLMKPFTVDQLAAKLRDVLEERSAAVQPRSSATLQ